MSLQRQCSWQNKAKQEGFEHILGAGFPQRKIPGEGPAQSRQEELTSQKYISGTMKRLPSSLTSTHLPLLPVTRCPSPCCGLQANTFVVLEVRRFLLTWPHRHSGPPRTPQPRLQSMAGHMAGPAHLFSSPTSAGVFNVCEDMKKHLCPQTDKLSSGTSYQSFPVV